MARIPTPEVGVRGIAAHRSGLAQPVMDGRSGADPYKAIDAYLERQLARLNVPGAVWAIVDGDRIAHQYRFGHAERDGAPASPQTPFVLGSTTKAITALAVMQLVEAGKVGLDAPVQRYLPWFRVADPQASADITVRHLLNQTSGLDLWSGWVASADFDSSPKLAEKHARALSTFKLTRPVGSAFEYTNTNFDLLGLIVEAASGESYPDYIQNHVFGPLDMRHSYTAREEAKRNGLAIGHRYWFAQPVAAPDMQSAPGSLASGELISCTEDMAHHVIAQLNGGRYGAVQVLSPAGIAEMHRPAVPARAMLGIPLGRYAMGWFVDDGGPTRVVWHDGIVPDFYSYVAMLPEQKKGIVLLVNADHFLMNIPLTEVGAGAAALLAGAQPGPIRLWPIALALRGLPLIPVLQVLGISATLLRVRRWRRYPDTRPSGPRKWLLHIVGPLIPNLLLAIIPVLRFANRRAGFVFRLAPDFFWTAVVSGSLAALWMFLRTWLTLRALRKPKFSQTGIHRLVRPRRAAA